MNFDSRVEKLKKYILYRSFTNFELLFKDKNTEIFLCIATQTTKIIHGVFDTCEKGMKSYKNFRQICRPPTFSCVKDGGKDPGYSSRWKRRFVSKFHGKGEKPVPVCKCGIF